jgi:hypothetical protein
MLHMMEFRRMRKGNLVATAMALLFATWSTQATHSGA